MANGDEAAAAGLAVFAPTQDLRQGYDNDNVRGDELARHIENGTHPFNKITGQIANSQLPNGVVSPAKLQKQYRAGYTPLYFAGGAEQTLNTGLTGPQVVTLTGVTNAPGQSIGGAGACVAVLKTVNYSTGVATFMVFAVASPGGGQPATSYVAWTAVQI